MRWQQPEQLRKRPEQQQPEQPEQLRKRPERQQPEQLRKQPEQQQPERQPELQRKQQEPVPEQQLLLFYRKQPEQRPTGRRSAESFSWIFSFKDYYQKSVRIIITGHYRSIGVFAGFAGICCVAAHGKLPNSQLYRVFLQQDTSHFLFSKRFVSGQHPWILIFVLAATNRPHTMCAALPERRRKRRPPAFLRACGHSPMRPARTCPRA